MHWNTEKKMDEERRTGWNHQGEWWNVECELTCEKEDENGGENDEIGGEEK